MKKICPYCEAETEVEVVEKIERINIRGETIEVLAHPYLCLACGDYFEDPKTGFDFLQKAYEEYRRRKGLTCFRI
ncbi:MAG: YgiT-type zinc finger protein [Deltaproteobacteria bacterium]|nr:YgiT-type zinc finger protein [Deltaproteobacteria bacterium]